MEVKGPRSYIGFPGVYLTPRRCLYAPRNGSKRTPRAKICLSGADRAANGERNRFCESGNGECTSHVRFPGAMWFLGGSHVPRVSFWSPYGHQSWWIFMQSTSSTITCLLHQATQNTAPMLANIGRLVRSSDEHTLILIRKFNIYIISATLQ